MGAASCFSHSQGNNKGSGRGGGGAAACSRKGGEGGDGGQSSVCRKAALRHSREQKEGGWGVGGSQESRGTARRARGVCLN